MTSRLEKKVVTCMENKEYYEAHQIFRTLYYRMTTAKKFAELLAILFDGSLKLLAANEIHSGSDLADLFVNTLIQSSSPPCSLVYDRLEKLLEQLCVHSGGGGKNDTDSDSSTSPKGCADARNKFVSDAIKWSQSHATKNREKKRGLTELHLRFGKVFWKLEEYEAARAHMLVSEEPEQLATLLIEMHQNFGHPDEADLFIALAVLQLLSLHRVKTADQLLKSYVEKHPAMKFTAPPYPLPLVNFLWLLICAIPSRNVSHYQILTDKYKPSLTRDPNYRHYLDKIGQLFFHLPAPQSNAGGLFGNMFKGLLGEVKKEEEESFSDSDVEFSNSNNDVDMDDADEDGYATAEDETSSTPRQPANTAGMDQMDDLD